MRRHTKYFYTTYKLSKSNRKAHSFGDILKCTFIKFALYKSYTNWHVLFIFFLLNEFHAAPSFHLRSVLQLFSTTIN